MNPRQRTLDLFDTLNNVNFFYAGELIKSAIILCFESSIRGREEFHVCFTCLNRNNLPSCDCACSTLTSIGTETAVQLGQNLFGFHLLDL